MPKEEKPRSMVLVGEAKRPIATTLAFWQQRTSQHLTQEDARQIVENATSFLRVLIQWDAGDRRRAERPGGDA